MSRPEYQESLISPSIWILKIVADADHTLLIEQSRVCCNGHTSVI